MAKQAPVGVPLEDLKTLVQQYKEKVIFFQGGVAAIQSLIQFCTEPTNGPGKEARPVRKK